MNLCFSVAGGRLSVQRLLPTRGGIPTGRPERGGRLRKEGGGSRPPRRWPRLCEPGRSSGDPVAARRVAAPAPLTVTCQTKYSTLPGPDPQQPAPRPGDLPRSQPPGVLPTLSAPSLPPGFPPQPPFRSTSLSVRTLSAGPADPIPVWAPRQVAVKRRTRGLALPLTTSFFPLTSIDRKPAPTHLPLARTSSSPAEEEKLVGILEELARRFK